MSRLIDQLQPFKRKSGVYNSIFNAEEPQLEDRQAKIDDLVLQYSVDTATWGLVYFDREYGLPIDTSKPLSERRAQVKARMRGSGTVNAELIKEVALAFTGGEIDVGFDGKIQITFTDVIGTPPNLADFKEALEEIKPAFLDIVYTFLYNQYQELTRFTYGDLAAFTHAQLRSTRLT